MMSVLAGAIEECAGGGGFGRNLSVSGFLDTIGRRDQGSRSARELDWYVEAQIHGTVDLAGDVAAMHLDPSFDGTQIYRDLHTAARRYGLDLTWSEGSEVRAMASGYCGRPVLRLLTRPRLLRRRHLIGVDGDGPVSHCTSPLAGTL